MARHKSASISNQIPAAAIGRGVNEACLLFFVVLLALVIRIPYWQTIPAAGDEVNQAIYALRIVRGEGFPLVGNDAYAGPFFFYLLALLFRLGVTDPLLGRAVVMIAGILTAATTCAWVRCLGGNRVASLVAAALVATNPHLVLLNSHIGGTTFLLPFLTTLFLWLLSQAVRSDHFGWLIASTVAAGLAIQSNPVAGLLIAGSWAWFTFRVRRSPLLGRRWPLWPFMGALCIILVYSPVIVHNLRSDLDSVVVMEQRSYLWETEHSARAFLGNERRLVLQLARQTAGVLTGDETFRPLLGLPLLYLAWMLAGLVFTTRKISLLAISAVLPFLLMLPYFSNHYGLFDPVRFTSLLTPVFAACMGLLFAASLQHPIRFASIRSTILVVAFGIVLVVYPLVSLCRYYAAAEQTQLNGRTLLVLSRQMVAMNRGEPVYISYSDGMMRFLGIPYVPQMHLLLANKRQEFLPPKRIIGRLFEFPGPAFLLISDQDAASIRQVAALTPCSGAANEQARRLGYGLYALDTAIPLIKPGFVLAGTKALDVKPKIRVGNLIGGKVELLGYDAPDSIRAGETLELTFYWRAVGYPPQATYIGFVHLYAPTTGILVAQDDHLLGQEEYPLNAWQLDEVVMERYALRVPQNAAPGQYVLRSGIYTWPDLVRLDVPEQADDAVPLQPVHVGQ